VSKPKPGDLMVSHFPQVPCKSFDVHVASIEDAARIMDLLAEYDDWQFRHRIKPDYSNATVLQVYDADADGDGNPDWTDWHDEETDESDPRKVLAMRAEGGEA
jgi:hypothetical protein